MKKLYLLIILFAVTFLATQVQAQSGDPVRVLFLGNSFIGANNLPGIFEALAQQAGHNVIVQSHAPGGVYIGDTRPGPPSHAYDPMVHGLLKSEKWDYVVAQDNQGHYSYGIGVFPPYAEVYKGHNIIRDTLLSGNPCGKLILFAGWCYRDGWPGEFPDGKSMNQRVYENYVYVNNTVKQIVSPIGIAWNRVIDSLPGIDLWSSDGAHPSMEGSYVTAATIYATIFRSNPDTVHFDGGLPPSDARLMRRTAFRVVMDSLIPTALAPHTLSLTAGTLQLTAGAGFRSYQWYLGGKLAATTTTAAYTPAASGCYQVVGVNAAGCLQRSKVVCFTKTVTPASVGNLSAGSVHIFPNPASGKVSIQLKTAAQHADIAVYDLKGSVVYRHSFGAGSVFENALPQLASGTYLLRISTEAGTHAERLQISN